MRISFILSTVYPLRSHPSRCHKHQRKLPLSLLEPRASKSPANTSPRTVILLREKNPSLVSVLRLNPVQGRLLRTLLGAQMLQHLSPLPAPLPIPSVMIQTIIFFLRLIPSTA
jgi:hypothetical protein